MGSSISSLRGTLVLLCAVGLALSLAAEGREERPPPALAAARAEPAAVLDPDELARIAVARTPRVARRVERIRELGFDQVPEPRLADTEKLRRLFERELAKPSVARDLRVDEAALRLLGMLEPEDDFGEIASDATAAAAAYYDPKQKRLFVLEDAVPAGPAVIEFVLAHELTHALEDQRFGLPDSLAGSDERVLAESALVEGTATAVMNEYAALHLDFLDLAAEAGAVEEGDVKLPGFLDAQVNFSYLRGQAFVEDLVARTGDWTLVDYALAERPPETSEQVLHPVKYLLDERPLTVRDPPGPGPGWRRLDADVVGEFLTGQILRVGDESVQGEAAAGWGGDRYGVWRRDGAPARCADRCRSDYAIAIAWRWETTADADEFRRALEAYVETGLEGTAEAGGVWRLDGGAAAIAAAGDAVRFALAPTVAMAERMVGG